MHHQSDDDHFAPPLKVLRKRLNGVYREDHGFSGPTRRYVIMVALLVGLASVPTLAVLTTGSGEISGRDRPGAMDVPFLPPPPTGPVGPQPSSPSPSAPSPSAPSPSASSPSSPSSSSPSAPSSLVPAPSSSVLKPPRRSSRTPPSASGSAGVLTDKDQTRHGYGGKRPTISDRAKPRKSPARKSPVRKPPSRKPPAQKPNSDKKPVAVEFPTVPDLPRVPEENDVYRPEEPAGIPVVPDLPNVPSDDEPDWRHCESATVRESSSRRRTVQPVRSRDRSEPSRRSAVAERPYNIRPARILEQSYPEQGLNMHRLLTQPRSEEERMLINRPYRGQHRADQLDQADERTTAAWQRSTRVGRHHAEPIDDHHTNRR
ncbi:hypothetical protein [Actinoplanes sp. NPDC023714]|uniref:hypothetical protein n=1 Tax=Actinoplanes sp. NPDC023714 TaxID=3154322 RepID=UPI0033E85CA6